MATHLFRRRIARHAAERIISGDENIGMQLAGYLIKTGRVREVDLLVRDIERELMLQGHVVADVESARRVSKELLSSIESNLKSIYNVKNLTIRQKVSQNLLGGIKITTPDATFDNTLRRRLQKLKIAKEI